MFEIVKENLCTVFLLGTSEIVLELNFQMKQFYWERKILNMKVLRYFFQNLVDYFNLAL